MTVRDSADAMHVLEQIRKEEELMMTHAASVAESVDRRAVREHFERRLSAIALALDALRGQL